MEPRTDDRLWAHGARAALKLLELWIPAEVLPIHLRWVVLQNLATTVSDRDRATRRTLKGTGLDEVGPCPCNSVVEDALSPRGEQFFLFHCPR